MREPHDLAQPPRTRLRLTALPTWRDTVKPTRAGFLPSWPFSSPSWAKRACRTKAPAGARAPLAAARKSVRRFKRSMCAALGSTLGRPLRADREIDKRNENRALNASYALSFLRPCARRTTNLRPPLSPCGRESRGGACAPICSADRSVSRNGLRWRPEAPRLARLIRKRSRLVNVTSPRFVGDWDSAPLRPDVGFPLPSEAALSVAVYYRIGVTGLENRCDRSWTSANLQPLALR